MLVQNRLLSCANCADRELLVDKADLVEVPARSSLQVAHMAPSHVYFIETGVASSVYRARGDFAAEVALIGPEGCTGLSTILGSEHSSEATTMLVRGEALRVRIPDFLEVLERRPPLHRLLLRFAHTQVVQRNEAILAACKAGIPQRLARLLLMLSDRMGTAALPLTHETMAMMLCTRRAGITITVGDFRHGGLIVSRRGGLQIKDRERLLKLAGPYYGAAEAEFDRLFACRDNEKRLAKTCGSIT